MRAEVSDISKAANFPYGEERSVHGDAGYLGSEKGEELPDRENHPFVIAKKRNAARQ